MSVIVIGSLVLVTVVVVVVVVVVVLVTVVVVAVAGSGVDGVRRGAGCAGRCSNDRGRFGDVDDDHVVVADRCGEDDRAIAVDEVDSQ